jgi:hypothetical protein
MMVKKRRAGRRQKIHYQLKASFTYSSRPQGMIVRAMRAG